MKVFIYPTNGLLFEWPYFEECTTVQDLFLSELKLCSCDSIDDADIAFFPLMLGSAFQHQRSPHTVLSSRPNLQYEWRTKWSKLIQKSDQVQHFVLLSYVLYNVNLSFIPSNFIILCNETEVTMDIHGTLANFGCLNRIITIPYYVDTKLIQSVSVDNLLPINIPTCSAFNIAFAKPSSASLLPCTISSSCSLPSCISSSLSVSSSSSSSSLSLISSSKNLPSESKSQFSNFKKTPYVESKSQEKMIFIGSLKHANKFRDCILKIFTPFLVCYEPQKNMDYLSLYKNAITSLVLRGDTPTRCAFYQSLLSGCCPIIYKHCFLHYKKLFGGILPIEKLCIIIPDFDFDIGFDQNYQHKVHDIVFEYLSNTSKQQEFQLLVSQYKYMLDYHHKMENGLSAPIHFALTSILKKNHNQTNKCRYNNELVVFIANLDGIYNSQMLPIEISTRDIVSGKLTSQYELEIYWFQIIKNLFTTSCIQNADFVFIPFYTFLSGWSNKQFSNNRISLLINKLIKYIPSWKSNLLLPHVLVYSDVCWNSSDSFLFQVTDWPSNTILISLESISHPIIKTITSPYLTGFDNNDKQFQQKFNNTKRNIFLSYIGRMRIPFMNEYELEGCKFYFIEMEGWKSINEPEFLNLCLQLYSQSYFALQPPGDRETRRGFFQCLLLGCIPVIFKDNQIGYQQHTLLNIESICVVIPFNAYECSIEFILDYLKTIDIEPIKKNILKNIDNYIFTKFDSKPIMNILSQIFK